MHNEIGWPDCQMAMPLGMVARWQIIRWSCKYMRTSNLDMVLFTIKTGLKHVSRTAQCALPLVISVGQMDG